MKLIDTHCHLQFKVYDQDRDKVVKRSSRELEALVNVGTSVDASEKGIKLAQKIANFYASIGVHPHHVDQWDENTYNQLNLLAQNPKVVAVGEIGLDKHLYKGCPEPDLASQTRVLHEQINLALELGKPILFHCRDAYRQLYKEIKGYQGKIRGLVHCFMGSEDQAKKFLDLNLYISFSGNITYKGNSSLREVAKIVPAEKILVETDAPFLPPEPYRGRRNEPAYVKILASSLANLRIWSEDKTCTITSQNAKRLLQIP